MIPPFADAVPRRPVDDAKEAHLFGGLWLIAIYKHTHTHTAAELRRGRMTYILGSIRTYIRTQVWCTCISRVGRRRGDGVAAAAAAMRLRQQIRILPAAHLTTYVLMRRTRYYNSNNNNDNNDNTVVVVVSVYNTYLQYASDRVGVDDDDCCIARPNASYRTCARHCSVSLQFAAEFKTITQTLLNIIIL